MEKVRTRNGRPKFSNSLEMGLMREFIYIVTQKYVLIRKEMEVVTKYRVKTGNGERPTVEWAAFQKIGMFYKNIRTQFSLKNVKLVKNRNLG